jgi:hypothetical protein
MASLEHPDHPVFSSGLSDFGSFRIEQEKSQIRRFDDSMCFEARKETKRHQGTKIEENQGRSRSRKKLDHQVCQTGLFGFPRTDRVRVGFEILFV